MSTDDLRPLDSDDTARVTNSGIAAMPEKAPLDEVMLAMDVVDTLRHRKVLIDRELNADAREQNLIQRLRELYASQGIEVTDEILAEGVQALQEDRFRYTPTPGGFQTMLARIYIERGKWGRRIGVLLLLLVLVRGGIYLFVDVPANHEAEQQLLSLNQSIQQSGQALVAMDSRRDRLQRQLDQALGGVSSEWAQASRTLETGARQALLEAGEKLRAAREIELRGPLADTSDSAQRLDSQQQLQHQQVFLDAAAKRLDTAQAEVGKILELGSLPIALAAERDSILQAARVDEAKTQARTLYADASAALIAGDIDTARSKYAQLKALRAQLALQYRLRIVSQDGERSGVWRIPDQNPDAKNYYLIVEAIGPDGKPLSMPILNEEDGQTYQVKKWGLRVSQGLFQKVAADKRDDGIIQMRELGRKAQGELQAELSIKTDGASITSW